jgi:hypothetical protein
VTGNASEPRSDPRVYFAAERTMLAWLRTGIAIMAFGFVVARFGLVLRLLRDLAVPRRSAGRTRRDGDRRRRASISAVLPDSSRHRSPSFCGPGIRTGTQLGPGRYWGRARHHLAGMTRRGLLLTLTLSGCGAGWHRVEPQADTISARQQVQVWHEDRFERWHALRLSHDTISGVPYFRGIGCDSCRLGIPRADVDSLRYGNPTAGFWKTVGLVFGVSGLVAAAVCGSDGSGCVD